MKKIWHYFERFSPFFVMLFFNVVLLQLFFIIFPNSSFLHDVFNPQGFFQIIIGTFALFFLYPRFVVGTWEDFKKKTFGMMFLIMLSVTIAYLLSLVLFIINLVNDENRKLYFDAAVTILVFLTLGILIEEKISVKGNYDIRSILKLKNPKVLRMNGNLVKLETIKKGDLIIINKDSDILVDGKIVKGNSYVSEAFLTGESFPLRKNKGDFVNAGSTNLGHQLVVEVENTLETSNISRIIKQAEQLSQSKPKIQRFADVIAKYFVIAIFIAFIIAFLYKFFVEGSDLVESIIFSISIFVMACPCALGVLTPGILMLSSSTLNKKSILIKNKEILEKIKNIKVAAFDKTGTVVSSILTISDWKGDDSLLGIIKGMEVSSNHPIARSLLGFKPHIKPNDLEAVKEIVGVGLEGKYKGNIYFLGGKKLIEKQQINYAIKEHEIVLICNKKIVTSFLISSKLNPKLNQLVKALKKYKIHTALLSGDFQNSVDTLNKEVSFDLAKGDLSPNDKADYIRMLQKDKGKVLYIGDGINDIVALSKADVSIAIASDYNAFNVPSDAIIFNDQVANVWPMIDIMNKTRKYVIVGICWAFIYNLTVVIAAIFLNIDPSLAAVFEAGSDVVILCIIFGYKLLRLEKKEYYEQKNQGFT